MLVSLLVVQSLAAWPIAPVKVPETNPIPTPAVERIVVMPDETQQQALRQEITGLTSLVDNLLTQLDEQAISLDLLAKGSGTDLETLAMLRNEIDRLDGLLKISQADYATLRSDYDALAGDYAVLDSDFSNIARKYDDKAIEVATLEGKLKAKTSGKGRVIVGADALYQDGRYGVGGNLGIRLFSGLILTGGVEWMVGDPMDQLRYKAGLSWII